MKTLPKILLAVALATTTIPSKAAGPLAPIAVVLGGGAAVGGAVLTFYYLQPTWRCWSDLDENGIVLTNYCSTLARCKQDDEHKCAGPNFKSKSKCVRICCPVPGVPFDEVDDPEYTVMLETSTTADGSDGWSEVGLLEVEMNSEFPQISVQVDPAEPQLFFRVRVDLIADVKIKQ